MSCVHGSAQRGAAIAGACAGRGAIAQMAIGTATIAGMNGTVGMSTGKKHACSSRPWHSKIERIESASEEAHVSHLFEQGWMYATNQKLQKK